MPVKNKGRHARTKGHSFERKCAQDLRRVFPDAKRHLENQKEEAKGYDLDNTGVYKMQMKRYKKYAPLSAIEEVQLEPGDVPVLVTKGDNKPALACVPFYHFIDLIEAAQSSRERCVSELSLLESIEEDIGIAFHSDAPGSFKAKARAQQIPENIKEEILKAKLLLEGILD